LANKLELEFTVKASENERRLFTVRERADGDLIVTPTYDCGIHVGTEQDPIYGGPLEFSENTQFTVHYCPEHPVMSRINYKKQSAPDEKIKRIVTNGLKIKDRYFPLFYCACTNLLASRHDPTHRFDDRRNIAAYFQNFFSFSYQVVLSSKETSPPQLEPREIDIRSYDFEKVRMHILSFCLFTPHDQTLKGLRHTLPEYPANLNLVPIEKLAHEEINSLDQAGLLNLICQHVVVTSQSRAKHYTGPYSDVVHGAYERNLLMPIAPSATIDFLKHITQRQA
jgi:hypothetical protein